MVSRGGIVIISHKYRFIFIKTRKTAGTSVEVYLSQICADSDIFTPITPPVASHKPRNYKGIWNPVHEYRMTKGWKARRMILEFFRRRRFYNHIPAAIVRSRMSEVTWQDYFKFCIERNPWDKTISHYAMRRHNSDGQLTVDEYFRQGYFCQNFPLYLDRNGGMLVDRVIKYETLNEELAEVFESLGIPYSGRLGIRAKSTYRESQEIDIDAFERHRHEIRRVYRKEIEMHGY